MGREKDITMGKERAMRFAALIMETGGIELLNEIEWLNDFDSGFHPIYDWAKKTGQSIDRFYEFAFDLQRDEFIREVRAIINKQYSKAIRQAI